MSETTIKLKIPDGSLWPETIVNMITRLSNVDGNHPPYNSYHEGYGVLMEEVEELFDEIKKKPMDRSLADLYNEALDVAVVAMRIAHLAQERTTDEL